MQADIIDALPLFEYTWTRFMSTFEIESPEGRVRLDLQANRGHTQVSITCRTEAAQIWAQQLLERVLAKRIDRQKDLS